MQRISPFLWFDNQAEEAVKFYCAVFKNSKIKEKTYYTGAEPMGEKGSVLTVVFELNGQEFVALNGGPRFKFSEAISFAIKCDSQDEIDYYWEKLTRSYLVSLPMAARRPALRTKAIAATPSNANVPGSGTTVIVYSETGTLLSMKSVSVTSVA